MSPILFGLAVATAYGLIGSGTAWAAITILDHLHQKATR
jgi:hypothetical protein